VLWLPGSTSRGACARDSIWRELGIRVACAWWEHVQGLRGWPAQGGGLEQQLLAISVQQQAVLRGLAGSP
jgi:hypothetical protein